MLLWVLVLAIWVLLSLLLGLAWVAVKVRRRHRRDEGGK
jgi:hypothetical protein